MFKQSLLFIFLFSFLSFNLHASGEDGENGGKWELITVSEGIEMFERWISISHETKVRERTGKMTLACSADKALKFICDPAKTKDWMCNVEKVSMLKQSSESDFVVHTILDTPWPFNKQDMVSNYKVIHETTGVIRILVISENELLPKQEDIDRLDTFHAEWVLKPAGKNKVKITFTTKSTRPPEYPSWVQDPVVRKIFITNLKNLKTLVNQA